MTLDHPVMDNSNMQALFNDSFAFPPTTAPPFAATAPHIPSRTYVPPLPASSCPAMSNAPERRTPEAPVQPHTPADRQDGAPVDSDQSPDGPTHTRNYVTPSSTSKKDIPAFYARKRARSQAFGDDEEDELPEELPPSAGATDQEKIEYRRRRNTLAARRSRQKKADKMATLEDDVRRLTSDRDTWKTRAQTLRQLLLSHGIPCKEFED